MTIAAPSGIITITTDFGIKDGNVAAMKGVIWTIFPAARIADVSHLVPPQQVALGSRLLARRSPFFPPGTVHIAVVDPGVGTARRPMAARIGQQFFVGPDNGLFTPQLAAAGTDWQAIHLTERRFWLQKVSNVFHGRDIFAPVAAHLAAGVALTELGEPLREPVQLNIAQPRLGDDGAVEGIVAEVDHFGNLGLNIDAAQIAHLGPQIRVSIAGQVVAGVYRTFGDGDVGTLIVFIDSSDGVAIAQVNGSAAARLGVGGGEPVVVRKA